MSPEDSSLLALGQLMARGSEPGRSQGTGPLEGKEQKGSPEHLALAAEEKRETHIVALFSR